MAFADRPQYRNGPIRRWLGAQIVDRVCQENGIAHRLTKPSYPGTNGQAERVNRTVKDAAVKGSHDETLDSLEAHVLAVVAATPIAPHRKRLRWRTPFQAVRDAWTKDPAPFKLNPHPHIPEPYNWRPAVADAVNFPLILSAAFLASASPGPATLAIADTAMRQGRRLALALAAGITTGSLFWSICASLGIGALMAANAWMFEALRYAGAGYLIWLAARSARNAIASAPPAASAVVAQTPARAYLRGLALHLTNPKAILFLGSLYAVGLAPDTSPAGLASVVAIVGLQSGVIFHVYALAFSNARVGRTYARLRRGFEAAFALAFGAAGLRLLTTRL